ncbi:hypothetical protein PG993_002572 [Apiospora rasikravindrae]|uniref:CorA-like transporter domain-containing protein n=1 Tax=Apiospora rasikravindrae TaxID=990691 RepID=A0ABR1TXG1_9PEZI
MTNPKQLFEESCQKFLHYPQNLAVGRNFDHILAAYAKRLNDDEDRLFDDDEAEVLLWDLQRGASSFYEKSASDLDSLTNHVSGGQTDSLCRHVLLSANHSRAPLDCSGPMLKYLLSYHQTMPQYLDLLFSFGYQELPRDFYYTSFEQETLPSAHDVIALSLPHRGRSGHEFRQCYNLWSVEKEEKEDVPDYAKWQTRQAATYHSFDTQSGSSLWISTKANKVIHKRIQEATKSFPPMQQHSMQTFEGAFAATLFTHLISFEWCSENWRWYIASLGDSMRNIQIKTEVSRLDPLDLPQFRDSANFRPADLLRMVSGRGHLSKTSKPTKAASSRLQSAVQGYLPSLASSKSAPGAPTSQNFSLKPIQGAGGLVAAKQPNSNQSDPFKPLNLFTFGEYQTLQRIGERLQEAHLVIGLNIGILDKVTSSYAAFAKSDQIPNTSRKAVKSHVAHFLSRCASIRQSLKTQQQRLEVQIQILEGTKSLFNNILEFRNTEINKSFALNQYWSNMTMEKIAQRTAHETASMHIITLVTLIFLPGTFVATFFNGGNFNWDSADAGGPPWQFNTEVFGLFIKVSIPMMAVVTMVWFGAYWWARGTSRKELEDIEIGKIA